jgi:hypothetical protein
MVHQMAKVVLMVQVKRQEALLLSAHIVRQLGVISVGAMPLLKP